MKKTDPRWNDNRITHGSDNVFIDVGFEPSEARIMLMHADLRIDIEKHILAQGWTQAETAKRLGITQPRVSRLLKGRSKEFSIDMLLRFADRLGMRPQLRLKSVPPQRIAA